MGRDASQIRPVLSQENYSILFNSSCTIRDSWVRSPLKTLSNFFSSDMEDKSLTVKLPPSLVMKRSFLMVVRNTFHLENMLIRSTRELWWINKLGCSLKESQRLSMMMTDKYKMFLINIKKHF